MASVAITISGVLFDKYARTGRPVTLVGEASLTGFGVGGGPIMPGPPDEKPPGFPPGIWPGPGDPDYPGGLPHPAHPIVLPPGGPPVIPPTDPPTGGWEWGWNPQTGWLPVYTTGDKPRPPAGVPPQK